LTPKQQQASDVSILKWKDDRPERLR